MVPGPGWSRAGSRTRPGGSHEDPVLLCPAGGQPCPLPTCLRGQRTEPPYLGWSRSSDCSKRPDLQAVRGRPAFFTPTTWPAGWGPSLLRVYGSRTRKTQIAVQSSVPGGPWQADASLGQNTPTPSWRGLSAAEPRRTTRTRWLSPGAALATLETQSYSPATRHGPGTDAETWPRGALTELRRGRAGPPRPPPSDSASRVLGVTEVDAGVAWRTGSGTPQPQLRKTTARTSPGAGTFPSSRGPRLLGRTCPSAPTHAHRGFCVSSSPAVAPVALALPFPESGSVSRPPLTGRQGAGPNLTGAAGPRPLGLPEASR